MQAAQLDPIKRTVKSSVEKSSPAAISAVAAPAREAQTKVIKPISERSETVVSQSVSARMR